MSLNGLDEVAVIEAYEAALVEPGGWSVILRHRFCLVLTVFLSRFLLKYVTRDTIDLLQRGTGGVVEVRIAIEAYEEKSPVYGLVQYRRRKVVLKYVPEGTSRLLQGMYPESDEIITILSLQYQHALPYNFNQSSRNSLLTIQSSVLPPQAN